MNAQVKADRAMWADRANKLLKRNDQKPDENSNQDDNDLTDAGTKIDMEKPLNDA